MPNDDEMDLDGDVGHIGRRELLGKAAAAAGTMGVVWAAPTIHGLATQPAFGAVSSPGACGGRHTVQVPLPANQTFDFNFVLPVCGGYETNWKQQIKTDSTGDITITKTGGAPNCTITSLTFNDHVGRSDQPGDTDNVTVGTPPGGGHASISGDDSGANNDFPSGGNASVTVTCT